MQLIKLEEQGLTAQELNDIIEVNMGLVKRQIRRFDMWHDAEAWSQATEALMRAAQTYDDTHVAKFSTYATACIYNALCGHYNSLHLKTRPEPYSYNAPVDSEDVDTYEDFLTDGETIETFVDKRERTTLLSKVLKEEIDKLPDLKQRIIYLWEENDFKVSDTAIAEEVGCSQSYVSFTLKVFCNNMRKALKGKIEL